MGIGATTYQELPAKPGFFTIVPIPDGYPLADDVLDTLRGPSSEVGDVDVEQDGETYRLTLPARPSSLGEARVEAIVVEGRLQRLLMRWEDFGEEVLQDCEFSMYGNVPEIEPPPPDRLVPYAQELLGSPGLHACGPDGLPPPGELGCGSIGLPPS
ncbi:MAG: hypothetical protein M5U31_14240 [Acidimicrobiia bacterium]|nr:hypothetical protein [Acidimicrobiia bacterium]